LNWQESERVDKLILSSAVSKTWPDKNGKVYMTVKNLFTPKTERTAWRIIRFFSEIFPKTIANNFYSQLSINKVHCLENNDTKELLTTFTF